MKYRVEIRDVETKELEELTTYDSDSDDGRFFSWLLKVLGDKWYLVVVPITILFFMLWIGV